MSISKYSVKIVRLSLLLRLENYSRRRNMPGKTTNGREKRRMARNKSAQHTHADAGCSFP